MKDNHWKTLNINKWAPEDRPREKLLLKGTASLSDAELFAILLGSGTVELNAVDLSRQLLAKADNNLHELARMSVGDLMKVKGIGEAKAVTIVAALEIGRRRKEFEAIDRPRIVSSLHSFEELKPHLMDLPHEEFWLLMLNRSNRLIRKKKISEGGVSGTVADIKIIFKAAIEELASGIIVGHNHPSGNLAASQADITLTHNLRDAGRLLELPLLDHIIVAGTKYLSFADEGMM